MTAKTFDRRTLLKIAGAGAAGLVAMPAVHAQGKSKLIVASNFVSGAFAPAFVAQKAGFFGDEGLDVEIVSFGAQTQAIPQLARGAVHAYGGVPSAGFLNGLATDPTVKVITNGGIQPKTPPSPTGIYIRKADAASGRIKTIADLKGKKVASAGGFLGSAGSYWIGRYLEQGNLKLTDVELVNLPSSAAIITALENSQIDAGFSVYDFAKASIDKGLVQAIGDDDKALIGYVIYYYFGADKLMKTDRPLGLAFTRALLRASREHLQGDYRKNQLVVDAMSKIASIPAEFFTQSPMLLFDRNLTPEIDGLMAMQAMFRPYGLLEYSKDITREQMVDMTLTEDAAKSLKS